APQHGAPEHGADRAAEPPGEPQVLLPDDPAAAAGLGPQQEAAGARDHAGVAHADPAALLPVGDLHDVERPQRADARLAGERRAHAPAPVAGERMATASAIQLTWSAMSASRSHTVAGGASTTRSTRMRATGPPRRPQPPTAGAASSHPSPPSRTARSSGTSQDTALVAPASVRSRPSARWSGPNSPRGRRGAQAPRPATTDPSRPATTARTISLSRSTRAGSFSATVVQSPSSAGARRTWGAVVHTTGTPAPSRVPARSVSSCHSQSSNTTSPR